MTFCHAPRSDEGVWKFWRIDDGELLKEIPYGPDFSNQPDQFKWSFDGSYVATLLKNHICVFEVPSFELAYGDATAIWFKGVQDFAWHPTKNRLAYWIKDEENDKIAP